MEFTPSILFCSFISFFVRSSAAILYDKRRTPHFSNIVFNSAE